MKVGIISNPNSKKNKAAIEREHEIKGIVGDRAVVRRTETLDQLRPTMHELLDQGVKIWVSDGGDGTFHWMLNEGREALEDKGLWGTDGEKPLFVPTNGGTIDFVAKKAGIKGKADDIIESLLTMVHSQAEMETVTMDTLEVLGHRPGDPDDVWSFRKLGFAVAVGGIGQKFFSQFYEAESRSSWRIIHVILRTVLGVVGSLGPMKRLPFIPGWVKDKAMELLSGSRAKRVEVDGTTYQYDRYQGLHAGAITVDFGTLFFFEYAKEPGTLHVAVGKLPMLEAVYKWVWLVFGKPVPGDTWHEMPAKTFEVEAVDGEVLDPVIDGELFYGFDKVRVTAGPSITVPKVGHQ